MLEKVEYLELQKFLIVVFFFFFTEFNLRRMVFCFWFSMFVQFQKKLQSSMQDYPPIECTRLFLAGTHLATHLSFCILPLHRKNYMVIKITIPEGSNGLKLGVELNKVCNIYVVSSSIQLSPDPKAYNHCYFIVEFGLICHRSNMDSVLFCDNTEEPLLGECEFLCLLLGSCSANESRSLQGILNIIYLLLYLIWAEYFPMQVGWICMIMHSFYCSHRNWGGEIWWCLL